MRFSRRELREALHIGDTQLRIHLERLAQLELVLLHREGARFVYELHWSGEGENGARFVPGIAATTATSRGSKPQLAGASRASRGGVAAGSRPQVVDVKPLNGHETAQPAPFARQSNVTQANGANGANGAGHAPPR